MTVAPLSRDAGGAFVQLKALQSVLLESFPAATALSMGMSNDYEAAIEAGATHLRIGSSILGSRGVRA